MGPLGGLLRSLRRPRGLQIPFQRFLETLGLPGGPLEGLRQGLFGASWGSAETLTEGSLAPPRAPPTPQGAPKRHEEEARMRNPRRDKTPLGRTNGTHGLPRPPGPSAPPPPPDSCGPFRPPGCPRHPSGTHLLRQRNMWVLNESNKSKHVKQR